MKKYFSYLELIFYFVLIDAVNYLFFPENLGYLEWNFSPYWIPVILLPVRYGLGIGITTGVIAFAHVLFFTLGIFPSKIDLQIYFESYEFAQPLAFLIFSLLLGSIRQKQFANVSELREKNFQKEEQINNHLSERKILNEKVQALEKRIVGETSTIQTLYAVAKKLESLDLENIFHACLEIIQENFQVSKASLYFLEGKHFVLKAYLGWAPGAQIEGKIPYHKSIMSLCVKEKRLLTIKQLLAHPDFNQFLSETENVLALVPLMNNKDKVMGVLNIETIDFLSYNKQNLKLIELICDWTSHALEKKSFFDQMQQFIVYDVNSHLFTLNHFYNQAEYEFVRARRYGRELTLSMIKIRRFGFFSEETQETLHQTFSSILKQLEKDAVQIFLYRFSGTYAVLFVDQDVSQTDSALKNIKDEFYQIIKEKMDIEKKPDILMATIPLTSDVASVHDMIQKAAKECALPQT